MVQHRMVAVDNDRHNDDFEDDEDDDHDDKDLQDGAAAMIFISPQSERSEHGGFLFSGACLRLLLL